MGVMPIYFASVQDILLILVSPLGYIYTNRWEVLVNPLSAMGDLCHTIKRSNIKLCLLRSASALASAYGFLSLVLLIAPTCYGLSLSNLKVKIYVLGDFIFCGSCPVACIQLPSNWATRFFLVNTFQRKLLVGFCWNLHTRCLLRWPWFD